MVGLDRDKDPTLMVNQPNLRTSNGNAWLVVGAISAVLVGTMFALLRGVAPGPASAGLGAVTLGLIAMLVIRFGVRPLRARLASLLVAYLLMLGAALACAWLSIDGV